MFAPGGGLDVAALDAALGRQLASQKRALLFLNDPCHNPTGYSMTRRRVGARSSSASRRGRRRARSRSSSTARTSSTARAIRAPSSATCARSSRPARARTCSSRGARASPSRTTGSASARSSRASADEAERAAVEAALSYSCRGTWSNCNRGGLAAITRLLVDPDLARACAAERDGLKALLRARVDAFNAPRARARACATRATRAASS